MNIVAVATRHAASAKPAKKGTAFGKLASLKSKVNVTRSKVKGQRSKVEGQKSKVKGQRSKVKGQRSKVESRRSKVESQKSKVEGQKLGNVWVGYLFGLRIYPTPNRVSYSGSGETFIQQQGHLHRLGFETKSQRESSRQ